jgi:hypothetical protein
MVYAEGFISIWSVAVGLFYKILNGNNLLLKGSGFSKDYFLETR